MENKEQEIIKNVISPELSKMGIDVHSARLSLIRSKDGIRLYRVAAENNSYVLKYFEKDEYQREIGNYNILISAGIKTIPFIGQTSRSILLEDIGASMKYRLGKPEDLSDPEIAAEIANWYKSFHEKGKDIDLYGLYCETDKINIDTLKWLKSKTDTNCHKSLDFVIHNIDKIVKVIDSFDMTLNYNDFFWTNLIVAKDKTSAFVFDYNLMGKGYRYSDIRNVCLSLEGNAKEAFLEAYGPFDEREKIADDCVSAIVSLVNAYKKKNFPSWAAGDLDSLRNGELYSRTEIMLNSF